MDGGGGAPGADLRVVMLSYGVTELAGGPAVAAAGFAGGLARLGVDVALFALDNLAGRWLVDERVARAQGFAFGRVGTAHPALGLGGLLRLIAALPPTTRRTVMWVNAIWGAQSVAAWLTGVATRWPYVVRPAGNLGVAAMRFKTTKKRLYFRAVESRVLARATALHCMSETERDELPAALKTRAFVVPAGVDLPADDDVPRDDGRVRLGVLARVHPIKNHPAALDALEALVRAGVDAELEVAGSVNDADYEAALRARARASDALRGRVRFLGHVDRADVPAVVRRWRAALLLSHQENFGHAVVSAAAAGVPTVVAPGVALGADLAAAGAGVVVAAADAADGVRRLLARDRGDVARACRAFARCYGWDACAEALLDHLTRAATHGAPHGAPR